MRVLASYVKVLYDQEQRTWANLRFEKEISALLFLDPYNDFSRTLIDRKKRRDYTRRPA
jgi:hypothetical protein